MLLSYVVSVTVDYVKYKELKSSSMSGNHRTPIACQLLESHWRSGLTLSLSLVEVPAQHK